MKRGSFHELAIELQAPSQGQLEDNDLGETSRRSSCSYIFSLSSCSTPWAYVVQPFPAE
jgi:hypothetical protein